jgi:hypothetical protein
MKKEVLNTSKITEYHLPLDRNPIFKQVVEQLVANNPVEEIIETGTYHGTGSTKIFAETGKIVKTMECDINNASRAIANLEKYPNVYVYYALSLPKKDLIEYITKENYKVPEHIMVDSDNPIGFYINEVNMPVEVENLLPDLINNKIDQIVFLDSAGGVGFMEYQYVMSLPVEILAHKILMMDDVGHIKHYKSVEDLKERNCEVIISECERFAYVNFMEKFKDHR